ncbi:MAG: tail fiber domain-containing protein, partial [Candidatus Acidiferrum sp.]
MNNTPAFTKLTCLLAIACIALAPAALAVAPPPDGGYAGANTAEGTDALLALTTGKSNTAMGFNALITNSTGTGNTANGAYALFGNAIGSYNTANGVKALNGNTTGSFNTADGNRALYRNTTGSANTSSGLDSLYNNTTGNNNIALGHEAGFNLTTGSNNIDIGNAGSAGEAATIRIGTDGIQTNTYIGGISGVTVPAGIPVLVDADGHLGTTTSSARYKRGIKPMDRASEALFALQPVTFCYKQGLDPKGIPQFGLVAEQVEKVNPDLVARDDQGKPCTV